MHTLAVAFTLLLVPCEAFQQPAGESRSLIAENGATYTHRDETLELSASRGWLRARGVYLDFFLAFEFRTTAADTDAGVIVRTWTGKDGWPNRGYRFRLPTSGTKYDAASVFEARRQATAVIRRGEINQHPMGNWQKVELTGEGREISIVMNDAVLGVFDVEEFGGEILFDNRRGHIQLRNIEVGSKRSTYQRPGGVMTFAQLAKAGGQVPKLLPREKRALYTEDATRRKLQGLVKLEAVVLEDGSVGSVGVVHSLDPELDLSAVAALKNWKFTPGMLNGKPVAVVAEVEMTFTLR